jgi:hypothetical protein
MISSTKIDNYMGCNQYCLFCDDPGITHDSFEHGGRLVWRDVTCGKCGATWREEFVMTAISISTENGRWYSDESRHNQPDNDIIPE